YFAHLGKKRRRTYRTVRDVPSPPLDDEILEHLQRGELPPPDYGYTIIRERGRDKFADRRGQRPPRVHKRTIIELHLEVLHECEAAEWENVKDDYLQIVVEQFAQDLMRCGQGYSSSLDAPITNQDLSGINASSMLDPPTDIARTDPCPANEHDPDQWSCMETIPLDTDPCAPNAEDRWNCMETMQLDAQQSRAHSNRDHVTTYCTQWINWIDRNKDIVRACTTQPWFLQLKADWKQYLREHMAEHEDNGVSGNSELGEAAILPMKKVRLWKQWVAKQHALMHIYGEEEWFQHLLNNVQEATATHKGEVSVVEKDLEVEKVMAAEHMLRVRTSPGTQPLHRQTYMKKRLTAQTWILILALIIEECELESSMQHKDLYVDDLLQQFSH
ncbi:hypothetical protein AK88_05654, partial [Plasmodium fragile]